MIIIEPNLNNCSDKLMVIKESEGSIKETVKGLPSDELVIYTKISKENKMNVNDLKKRYPQYNMPQLLSNLELRRLIYFEEEI